MRRAARTLRSVDARPRVGHAPPEAARPARPGRTRTRRDVPPAAVALLTGRPACSGPSASAGRNRTGTGSGSRARSGRRRGRGARNSVGGGTGAEVLVAERAAVVGEHDVAARDADVVDERARHAARRRRDRHSGNGSASSASHSISVIGASSSGSTSGPPRRLCTTRVSRTAWRWRGSASRRLAGERAGAPRRRARRPAARSGWWPRSVARVAPRGRQQRSSPQV